MLNDLLYDKLDVAFICGFCLFIDSDDVKFEAFGFLERFGLRLAGLGGRAGFRDDSEQEDCGGVGGCFAGVALCTMGTLGGILEEGEGREIPGEGGGLLGGLLGEIERVSFDTGGGRSCCVSSSVLGTGAGVGLGICVMNWALEGDCSPTVGFISV